MSTTDNVTSATSTSCSTGRVKWFNNKAGYGFITITDGEKSGTDIFVHHSVINVENQQYKYLVQGEYVQFNIIPTNGGNHEFQASNVSGINAGKLMCETRFEFKQTRNNYKRDDSVSETPMPKQTRPRVRGEGSRDSHQTKDKNWTLVKNQKNETRTKNV